MTGPTLEPVTLYCVGGPLHGEPVKVPADADSWLHLVSATTYYVKPMTYVRQNLDGRPHSAWTINILVHETAHVLPDDAEAVRLAKTKAVNAMWSGVVMRHWMADNATQVPLADLPGRPSSNGHRKLHLPPDGGNLT